jgi:hypothetical protein
MAAFGITQNSPKRQPLAHLRPTAFGVKIGQKVTLSDPAWKQPKGPEAARRGLVAKRPI